MRDIKRCLAVLALTFCSMTNVFATDAIRPTTSACSMTAVPADSIQAAADSTGNVNAEKKTAVPKDTTANVNTNVDFNPQLYKMQKRHLEKNDSLSTDLLERFSVAIHTGARKIKPQVQSCCKSRRKTHTCKLCARAALLRDGNAQDWYGYPV